MSKHIFTGVIGEAGIEVQMGWDRPLQRYYLLVERNGRDEPLYDSIGDPRARTCQDLCYFRDVLAGLNVVVPRDLTAQVLRDKMRDTVNRVVHYDASGGLRELSPGQSARD